MQPGQPFDTKELDQQRAKQRRTLRLIPDYLVSEALKAAGKTEDVKVAEADRRLAEAALREHAENEIEFLAGFLATNAAAVAAAVIQPVVSELAKFMPGRPDDFYDLRRSVEAQSRNTAGVKTTDEGTALVRLVALLTWADELAGDYSDPRLEGWR